MTATAIFTGGPVFDGEHLHEGKSALFSDGVFAGLSDRVATDGGQITELSGDILSVGYCDLQVNGGDGIMLNDDPSVETLRRMARAHRTLGATRILPTLITDTREKTEAAIAAAKAAIAENVPGIAGLHLEGPHLSVARKGAHEAALIRPMEDADLSGLLAAKPALPALMVTIAPESVTPEQVATMARAGILVSLGHTDASYETCVTYAEAGARSVTHLFNAMSQLGSRAPGLVGAALDCATLSAGLIADAIHVHPAAMHAAWGAKKDPGRIFLVSDAMAVAGTDRTEFRLGGRRIRRKDGRLTLEDGTLAGADLDLTKALRVLVEDVGLPLQSALQAATSVPARLIGSNAALVPNKTRITDVIRIASDLSGARPVHA